MVSATVYGWMEYHRKPSGRAVMRMGSCGAGSAPLLLIAAVTLVVGCNNSRYGVHHDQRLPEIQHVGILAPSVKVYSLHTGGVLEERPDLEPKVQQMTVGLVREQVRKHGRMPLVLSIPQTNPAEEESLVAPHLALLQAVQQAITTHHYQHGKDRTFDYVVGDAPHVLGGNNVDALLCVYLEGAVPTSGRKFLKGTAIVMGALTGIRIHVKDREATMVVMLLDCRTQEVIWFNLHRDELRVDQEDELRRCVKKACAYLLKPRK